MNEKKKSFLGGAAILAVAGLICKVIGAVYKIPLRNMIGADAMGIYSTVYPIYTFLLVFSTSGIPTAISKLVAQERSRGNYSNAHKVFLTALKLLLLIGGITSVLMFFGSSIIASVLSLESWQPVAAIAPSLLFVSVISAYRGYYQGMQNMMPTAINQLVEQIIKLVAGFYFAYTWGSSLGFTTTEGSLMAATGALFGITLSEVVAFLVIFLTYQINKKKIVTFSDSVNKSEKYVKSLLLIAIPMTIGAAVKPLVDAVDSIMARKILEDTFHYSNEHINSLFGFLKSDCGTLINMPSVLTAALSMALVPAASDAMTGENGEKEVGKISSTGIKLSVIIGLPCSVGLFAFAEEILSFLYSYDTPAELATAAVFMRLLAFGVLFLSVIHSAAGVLQGLGKVSIPVITLAVGMAIKIIMNIVLIPSALEINAVPIGTITCYAIAAILDLIFVFKYTKTNLKFSEIIRPVSSAVIMGAVIYLAKILADGAIVSSKLLTLVTIAGAALVYGVCLVAFGSFTETDLDFMPGGRKIGKLLRKLGIKIRQ